MKQFIMNIMSVLIQGNYYEKLLKKDKRPDICEITGLLSFNKNKLSLR